MDKTLHLVAVNKENWIQCVNLKVGENQRTNLASNIMTIAESKFEEHFVLRAIKINDSIIGMLAYCPEIDVDDPGLYWLFRIMVDVSEQGKGYGKIAVATVIKEMTILGANRVRTMCKPSNSAARSLYLGMGFHEINSLDDGDIVFEMKINA